MHQPSRPRASFVSPHQSRKPLRVDLLEDRIAPATPHVAADGSDRGDGSAGAPLRSLQDAVNRASDGDLIRVAEGTYVRAPQFDTPEVDSVATDSVVTVFQKQVTIVGGYSTEDDFATRDLVNNPTVIDGEGKFRGLYVTGINKAPGLVLDGFVIQNGLGTPITAHGGLGEIYAFGGGLFLNAENSSFPFLFRNLTFRDNVARGGTTRRATTRPSAATRGRSAATPTGAAWRSAAPTTSPWTPSSSRTTGPSAAGAATAAARRWGRGSTSARRTSGA